MDLLDRDKIEDVRKKQEAETKALQEAPSNPTTLDGGIAGYRAPRARMLSRIDAETDALVMRLAKLRELRSLVEAEPDYVCALAGKIEEAFRS